jgi:hypothetical protein
MHIQLEAAILEVPLPRIPDRVGRFYSSCVSGPRKLELTVGMSLLSCILLAVTHVFKFTKLPSWISVSFEGDSNGTIVKFDLENMSATFIILFLAGQEAEIHQRGV